MKLLDYMRVVTHGGGAHRDDFLSVCLALALAQIWEVCRRDPTPAELDNPEVLVIDVGGRYEPENGNFDHHQFGRDEDPRCALSLFADHLKKLGYCDLSIHPWYEFTKILDSKGPGASATALGISKEAQEQMFSPVEFSLLKLFEQDKTTVLPGMRAIGEQLFSDTVEIGAEVSGLEMDVPLTKAGPLHGLATWRRVSPRAISIVKENTEKSAGITVAFSVTPDDRGEGWSLYRFDDHPQVDFSQLAGHPAIAFAHMGGFIAKTKAMTEEEAVKLVEGAIVKPVDR